MNLQGFYINFFQSKPDPKGLISTRKIPNKILNKMVREFQKIKEMIGDVPIRRFLLNLSK